MDRPTHISSRHRTRDTFTPPQQTDAAAADDRDRKQLASSSVSMAEVWFMILPAKDTEMRSILRGQTRFMTAVNMNSGMWAFLAFWRDVARSYRDFRRRLGKSLSNFRSFKDDMLGKRGR